MTNYKSDSSRLARLFRKSRDLWKERSNEKQTQLKLKDNTIRDLKISRKNWKNKSKGYKEELDKISKELEALKKKQTSIKN